MKDKHKLLLLCIKYTPWVLCVIYFLSSVLSYFNISTSILAWVGFTGFLSLIILYLCSIAFNFCIWHRLPLYYIFVCNIINFLNWINIPILLGLWAQFIIIGIFILLGAYLKNKYNEQIKATKSMSS